MTINPARAARNAGLFYDPARKKRCLLALILITAMVGAAEIIGEREIIFPEMAALTIGLWIIDKRVWLVSRPRLVLVLSLAAGFGVLLVRYSPFQQVLNLALAFGFAAICLMISRISLPPLISACMLPVLIHTESWVYPAAVMVMSAVVALGQWWQEKRGWRQAIRFEALRPGKKEALRWLKLLAALLPILILAVYTGNLYFILPPLIVVYVEFANSSAGFRNRPEDIYILLVSAALIGTVFELVGHIHLQLPQSLVALLVSSCLFILFEWRGKYFAPAGAIALVPMILPADKIVWLPLQVAIGAALLLSFSMIFFQKCYQWDRPRLIYCLVPTYMKKRRRRGNKTP